MNEQIQEGNERKNRKTKGGEDRKKPVEREGDERANTGRTIQRKKNRDRVKQRKGTVESPSKLQQSGASSSQHRTTLEQKKHRRTDNTYTEEKGRKLENRMSNTRIPGRH
jgi:hypothetical protein